MKRRINLSIVAVSFFSVIATLVLMTAAFVMYQKDLADAQAGDMVMEVFRYIKMVIPGMLLILAGLFLASLFITHILTQKLIEEQHADLLKSSKMRQEFTANVTHELKTPLTSISGYAELIETGLASGDDIVRFAKGIHKSANRLLMLINDIIRLSELDNEEEELATEELNLYGLASTCVEMLEPNGVFQLSERGFNAPAHGIEFFEFFWRKVIGIQIRNDGFKGIFRNWKSHNAKGKRIEHSRIMLF